MTLLGAKRGEWEAQEPSPNCPSTKPPMPRPLLLPLCGSDVCFGKSCHDGGSGHCHRPPRSLPPASRLEFPPQVWLPLQPQAESQSGQATPLLAPRMKSTLLHGKFRTPDGRGPFPASSLMALLLQIRGSPSLCWAHFEPTLPRG